MGNDVRAGDIVDATQVINFYMKNVVANTHTRIFFILLDSRQQEWSLWPIPPPFRRLIAVAICLLHCSLSSLVLINRTPDNFSTLQ